MTRLMTGHGKRRAAGLGRRGEDDSFIRIKLAKLGAGSSILSKSQSSPVIKMKSIISLKFSWEIFWKLSVKENDKTNVIFMPSFTHNRWSLMLTGSIPALRSYKTSPVIRMKSIEKYFGSSASKQMIRQMLSLCHHLPTNSAAVRDCLTTYWLADWPKLISVLLLYFTGFD